MIPDPMVRLREMAPAGVQWLAADWAGFVWFVNRPVTFSGVWTAPGRLAVVRNAPRPPRESFALNLRTGAAKFPDGATIPARVWMRYYRARAGGV